MAEIILALEKNLNLPKKLGKGLISSLGGVMVDPEMNYHIDNGHKEEIECNYATAVAYVNRNLGVKRTIIDPRLVQDKPYKMAEDVRHILSHKPVNKRLPNYFIPTHLTVSYFATRASIKAFIETCNEFEVEPVCFTTSSRSEKEDFDDRNLDADYFAKKSADVASELGFKAVMCAAVDSPLVKGVNPDLVTFVTGSLLYPDEPTNHVRTALISETASFTDFGIFGSAVFESEDPLEAIRNREIEYLINSEAAA